MNELLQEIIKTAEQEYRNLDEEDRNHMTSHQSHRLIAIVNVCKFLAGEAECIWGCGLPLGNIKK